ncbi:Acetyltransferase (GNAT) family protein [Actinacidiphila yanglinensis]|uniref:Acetyltransferase (GNAT) family protein n=2 Tax=Actinacidiphila yanglinensis TaxID=310779 RepID=A0A1H6CD69_9ACTN|nr:Acetyltransferase (GNAT) family protein [Actinacidiphila yanglinensis]
MAVADCVADLVNDGPDGRVLLITSAAGLLLAAGFHLWWTGRHGDTGERAQAHTRNADHPLLPAAIAPAPSSASVPGPTTLWRMRTTVRDAPGTLGAVCTALAAGRVDIVTLQTHPLADATVDEFLLRAPSGVPAAALALTVADAGGTDTWLERADAHDLVDMPTRMLTLATRTALDAAELPLALRQLFGRCTIGSTPAGQHDEQQDERQERPDGPDGERRGDGGSEDAPTVMRLRDPSGGMITVRREHLPFTPTEFARARALVELDARLGVRMPHRRDVLTLPEGNEISLRRARPEDHTAALALHERCSPATLAQRYHGPVADADRYLAHLLSPRFGQSLAVETASGRLVALGHLLWDGDENEVALLVEDDWQRRGIGAALLRKLVELAVEAGRESVYAVTRSANTGMIATMRELDLPLDYQVEDGTLVVTATLPAPAAGAPALLPWTVIDRPV